MPPREWRLRVEDILEAIARIARYVEGLTFEQFQADQKTVDAVIRNLEVIGEAVRHLGAQRDPLPSGIPWADIAGMRNDDLGGVLGSLRCGSVTDLPAQQTALPAPGREHRGARAFTDSRRSPWHPLPAGHHVQGVREYLSAGPRGSSQEERKARSRNSRKTLNRFFGSAILHEITSHRIEQFKRDRLNGTWRAFKQRRAAKPVKAGTVNRELDTLKSILSKAVEWKYLVDSPAKGVKRFRLENRRDADSLTG